MSLQFLAFTPDPVRARALRDAGVDGVVVDWETKGKAARQAGADTEINADTLDDLRAVATVDGLHRVVRIHGPGPAVAAETDAAIDGGATHVLLPMVRHPDEVRAFLDHVDGRAKAGILVETVDAVGCAEALAALPLDLVYVGLNDLRIDRGSDALFAPLIDGTAARLGAAFAHVPFGLGGATVLDGGAPIPARLLLAVMHDLGADFTFLRRSFRRDVVGRDLRGEVARIRAYWDGLAARGPAERAATGRALADRLASGGA